MDVIDDIGVWSEMKLQIVKEYASAYSKNISAQRLPGGQRFHDVYIDAFSGAGVHESRSRGDLVPGSPTNALMIEPRFKEYHFIDLDKDKAQALSEIVAGDRDVEIYTEDANVVLKRLIPSVRWDEYKRALCLLDPYGLHYEWEILRMAGASRTVEIFLVFMIYDINLNVLRRNPDDIDPVQALRLTAAWGDESWRQVAYVPQGLFGFEHKVTNEEFAQAYRDRLRRVAGFSYVPDPLPLHNRNRAVIYYIYFAAHKPVAADIVQYIFNKYRERGV